MESKQEKKTSKDILDQKKTDIPISSVKFADSWTFWENYESKSADLAYHETNKQIFKWNDIISFFQFWNKYPGNNPKNIFYDGKNIKYFFQEKLRIISMNIFKEGIKPLWEDENNNGGKYLQLEYQIKNPSRIEEFCKAASLQWEKLALCTMGRSLPGGKFINGIRFVDKTNFKKGNQIMFRIEIWVSKNIEENILNELKEIVGKNLGCEKVIVKDIKVN